MTEWYAVYTDARAEAVAAKSLQVFADDVLYPRIRAKRKRSLAVDDICPPLFPRYLFVKLDHENDFHRLRRASGVYYHQPLVGLSNQLPFVVSEDVIQAIRVRQDREGFVQLASRFTAGDSVRITDGPFEDQCGIFVKEISSEQRVILLLTVLGREQRLPFYSFEVESAA